MTVKDCVGGGGGKLFLNGCFSYSITFWKIVFQNMTGKQHSNLRPNFEDNETEINHGDIEIRRARGLEIYHLQQVSALNCVGLNFWNTVCQKTWSPELPSHVYDKKKKKKVCLIQTCIHTLYMYVCWTHLWPKALHAKPPVLFLFLFCLFCFVSFCFSRQEEKILFLKIDQKRPKKKKKG